MNNSCDKNKIPNDEESLKSVKHMTRHLYRIFMVLEKKIPFFGFKLHNFKNKICQKIINF